MTVAMCAEVFVEVLCLPDAERWDWEGVGDGVWPYIYMVNRYSQSKTSALIARRVRYGQAVWNTIGDIWRTCIVQVYIYKTKGLL